MHFDKLETNATIAIAHRKVERVVNQLIRSYDAVASTLRIGGRKAPYDDLNYEFLGGPNDPLRKKHYDKSLRLLWKAEKEAPQLDFRDCTAREKVLRQNALSSMTPDETEAFEAIPLPAFKEFLNREYSAREKEAIVTILSAIGHGEAYAWMVSTDVLNLVKSTGARAALTMQVMEEAKHFVVLRELIRAFDVPIPRQSVWEYILMERVHKSEGLEKFFGMNVLIEGIALSIFGVMGTLPGLEILKKFHLDESRHTALPTNYFREFPPTKWEQQNPLRKARRLSLILPTLALVPALEEDFAELGIDVFDFGGSVIRKVSTLAERNGFYLPISKDQLLPLLDNLFNSYCQLTRTQHSPRSFTRSETSTGADMLAVEKDIFFS